MTPYPPPWKQRLCFFDLETTGTNVAESAIIEIGAVTDDGGVFDVKLAITPAQRLAMHPKAQEVNGYTDEAWVGAMDPAVALTLFESFAWGCCMVGHNIGNFDQRLLARDFGPERYHALFRSTIDTYHLAKAAFTPDGLHKFNLQACCSHIGVAEEGVHRALGGAQRCQALFGAIVGRRSAAPAVRSVQSVASEF